MPHPIRQYSIDHLFLYDDDGQLGLVPLQSIASPTSAGAPRSRSPGYRLKSLTSLLELHKVFLDQVEGGAHIKIFGDTSSYFYRSPGGFPEYQPPLHGIRARLRAQRGALLALLRKRLSSFLKQSAITIYTQEMLDALYLTEAASKNFESELAYYAFYLKPYPPRSLRHLVHDPTHDF